MFKTFQGQANQQEKQTKKSALKKSASDMTYVSDNDWLFHVNSTRGPQLKIMIFFSGELNI